MKKPGPKQHMSVIHKRSYRAGLDNALRNRPWCKAGPLASECELSFYWKHVTCKNCLRHRPKRKGKA